jgi:hypothetical protein
MSREVRPVPTVLAVLAAGVLGGVTLVLAGSSRDVDASVHFDRPLRPWDGFGVTYVEAAQTRDYAARPQDYGGFSTLSAEKRAEILDLIFGEDGLRPGTLKMFLDPFHEGLTVADNDNGDPNVIDPSRFDHETTTGWAREFAREGLRRTREGGDDLSILTTLYGPPPWMTAQRIVRGRDLDPAMMPELAEYMTSWVKFLREEEQLPVRYLSVHNEGEDYNRWPLDGSGPGGPHHDYNMFWRGDMVVEAVKALRPMLDRHGLGDVGITPGETAFWAHFSYWGFAWDLAHDPEALASLGLITSHGFGGGAAIVSTGTDLLRMRRPDLHAWTTSLSWGGMDVGFLDAIRQNIYAAKVHSVIPWAVIQTDDWYGGDPNAGTAIRVDGQGGYTVQPGYYLYKHVTRAGQPGTAVAEVSSSAPDVRLIGFARSASQHPDAVVLMNVGDGAEQVQLAIAGSSADAFETVETSGASWYERGPTLPVVEGSVQVEVPARSVVTLFAAGAPE